jgi:hypothetical protein
MESFVMGESMRIDFNIGPHAAWRCVVRSYHFPSNLRRVSEWDYRRNFLPALCFLAF